MRRPHRRKCYRQRRPRLATDAATARDDRRGFLDAELARRLDDFFIDGDLVGLAGRLLERHDRPGARARNRFERVRADRCDAVVALEGAGGEDGAAQFR